jgi:hypothetical protein
VTGQAGQELSHVDGVEPFFLLENGIMKGYMHGDLIDVKWTNQHGTKK